MKYYGTRQYKLTLDANIKANDLEHATDLIWTNRLVPKDVTCSINNIESYPLRYDIECWGPTCMKNADMFHVEAISYTFLSVVFEAESDEEAVNKLNDAEFKINGYEFLVDEIPMDLTGFEAIFTVEEPNTDFKLSKYVDGKHVSVNINPVTMEEIEKQKDFTYNTLLHFGLSDDANQFAAIIDGLLEKINNNISIDDKLHHIEDARQALKDMGFYTEDMSNVLNTIIKFVEK